MKLNVKLSTIKRTNRHPKILIVADSPHWAFAQIQNDIISVLNEKYDFYWDYTFCHHYRTIDYKGNPILDIFYRIKHNFKAFCFPRKFKKSPWFKNTVTPFWIKKFKHVGIYYSRRVLPPWQQYDAVLLLDYYFDRVANLNFKTANLAKGVFTSTFPPLGMQIDYKGRNLNPFDNINTPCDFYNKFLSGTKAIVIGAPELARFYGGFGTPTFFVGLFDQIKKKRTRPLRTLTTPIIFGWMGNPSREEKHFWDVIEPVMKELEKKGLVTFKTRFSGPRESLEDFIQEVDIFISASESDVGPFMFVESALYDVPCITTKLGHAALILNHGENGWFIESTQESLRHVINEILKDISCIERVRSNVRRDFTERFNKQTGIQEWDAFFQFLINDKTQ